MKHKLLYKGIIIFFFGCGNYCETQLKPMAINAKIERKYIDLKNHATKMIVLSERGSNYEIGYEDRYTKDFWEFIQPGDSMIKSSSSLDVKIKRGKKEFFYTFNCSYD
ncbi:MAG: hypothetical protein LWX56_14675 [Ignavibacteria bacterium]|nr:hypothetical protein [Ignavibacteria bacterium]